MKGCLFFLLLFSIPALGQYRAEPKTWAVGVATAYQHQGVSMMKVGLWALRDLDYANFLRVDAGMDFAFHDKKTHYIPEVGLTYYLSAKGVWPSVKAEITPYSISPKAAVGIFNILELGVGYGFELHQKNNLPSLNGWNWSLGLSVPFNYYIK